MSPIDVIKKLKIKEPIIVDETQSILCPHKQINGEIKYVKVDMKKYPLTDSFRLHASNYTAILGTCYCGKTYIHKDIT